MTPFKKSGIKNLHQSDFSFTQKDYGSIYNKLINLINPSQWNKRNKDGYQWSNVYEFKKFIF